MKHRISILFILISCVSALYAQTYSNDWINYNQKYYKIPVIKEGIYRINLSQLVSSNVPTGEFQPQNLQIFHNGIEQPIYIKGEADGIFHATDYIEFYANRNTGVTDTVLYKNGIPLNPDYSIINDTAYYFLTWNNSLSNKRIANETSINFGSYSPETYCLTHSRQNYVTWYNASELSFDMTEGEGFTEVYFRIGTTKTHTLVTDNYLNVGIPTNVELCMSGSSETYHEITVTVPGKSFDTSYVGYKKLLLNFNTSYSLDSLSSVKVSSKADATKTADNNCFAYVDFAYTRDFNLAGLTSFSFTIKSPSTADKLYFNFKNFKAGVLYDKENGKRAELSLNGNDGRCLISRYTEGSDYFLSAESEIKSPIYIKAVKSKTSPGAGYFTDYSDVTNKGDFIILTHSSLWSSATQYKNYRQSTGYTVSLVDVNELYNQFGYGITKHPQSIREFLKYASFQWSSVPKYLLILGKGIQVNSIRSSITAFNNCLVPTMGYPSTDIFFSSALLSSSYRPDIPTGRIAAKSDYEVTMYLDKVKEYESNSTAEWMKNILHFGGGATKYEQQTFKAYLDGYKKILESQYFAGKVNTFLKASSDPIEVTKSEFVKQLVNEGCSMMTFFGHASGEGFDQNIDHPSFYNNKGKYPLILANSCYSGDVFNTDNASISETWLLIKDKGAIAFLAGVAQGYDSYLNRYSYELIKNIGVANYSKSIGICMKETINFLNIVYQEHAFTKFACMNFSLHGDPSIVLNSSALPDLYANGSSVVLDPEIVTTDIDSFTVKLIVKNIGKSISDTFRIAVNHTTPDGVVSTQYFTIYGCYFTDTLQCKFPVSSGIAGINSISVDFDVDDIVEELDELNNSMKMDFLISSNDLVAVYPYKFAIIPSNRTVLKASPVDPLAVVQQFEMEIDTSYLFDSPFKRSYQSVVLNSCATWNLPFDLKENSVYYWRVRTVTDNSDVKKWNESSFIYIEGKTGWSQADFPQFKDDSYEFIDYNVDNQSYSFIQSPKQLYISTKGLAATNADFALVKYTLDGVTMNWGSCNDYVAIHVVVIDPVDLSVWRSNRANYGHRNFPGCGPTIENLFVFTSSDTTQMKGMAAMLNDSIPDGYYVAVYSFKSPKMLSWPETALQAFENLGSNNIRSIPNDNPFIFFAKKGDISTAHEVIGITSNSFIEMFEDIESNYHKGSIKSVDIGPGTGFNTLVWDYNTPNPEDISTISIYGISKSGQEVLLASDIGQKEINALDTIVNDSHYQTLRLKFFTSDIVQHTPSQIVKWQLYYDEVPETAITLDESYSFLRDSLARGENLKLHIGSRNIGQVGMDTLLVRHSLVNSANKTVFSTDHRLSSKHHVDSVAYDSLVYNTTSLSGSYILKSEFNPVVNGVYDQLEKYHFNNLYVKSFKVYNDSENPLLNVTFDGVHILDGDIVSAKPEIVIVLRDENPYFRLTDTSLFNISLEDPLGQTKRIWFNAVTDYYTISFDTTKSKDNICTVTFNPVLAVDGMYTLKIQANDESGNASGDYDYIISFQVINKSSISNIINYPNPFTTSTRFVFTITGSELPTDLRIQIFTVSGKMVKEIVLDETSGLHIGNNISSYAWNGTDTYNDRLANGVYIYRVIAKIGSEKIDLYPTELDKFFKNGYGKMYLMK